ncbi:tudor domain-containing protein 3 isoform X1 [Tribolium castaneum]|uniref:Survival of motor neuron-related-splicing factor 30 n=1 Tax=Tribolium castaneum TaxID=7070 RepID=A0A139WJ13_TRICA|nr:PREDICTED: tudor domain-containing protein 3-like [Tribolium castaneum]KYB27777.1 Tudor domain-containing protein 3-like Protein [Tribolium castaneum]|eukprot:XP_001809395.1 PREDICTED: tudor domain-containing protein 3-like [Tribolium castaneum]
MACDLLGPGWNISEKGLEIITESNTVTNKSQVLKNALNSDLKEIGSPVLAKILNKSNVSQVVLQIQKIRNISAPKANEKSQAAPRMLKLVLTDGETYIQAIETSPTPSISDKTPPGTKILISSAKISSGYLLLDSNNCSLLGGKVPALYEKWEIAKSVHNHNRQNASSDGPPAWVNFGCKIQSDIQDKPFKSLDNKNQEVKENTKFDLQRQDAIAEATSGAVKKVFGGGTKPAQVQPQFPKNTKKTDFPKKNPKTKNTVTVEMDEKPQKPLERVSLFDFLEDKLPPNEVSEPPKNQQNQKNYNTFYHNQNKYKGGSKQDNFFKPRNEPQAHKNEMNGLTNNFEKMAINTQFASRSLKQHLNLGPQKKNSHESTDVKWKVGDDCVAKYWEDGKYYNANITAVTDNTCVVKFKGYGNMEEVLKSDCLPVETSKKSYSGPMEFRRNTRTYRRQ